jgi:hypothetical protein
MRRLQILLVALMAVVGIASADTIPCATSALSTYTQSGFTCMIDHLIFSDFVYTPTSSGGPTLPTTASIQVNPYNLTNPGSGNEMYGLQFLLNNPSGPSYAQVNTGQTMRLFVQYTVAPTVGYEIVAT